MTCKSVRRRCRSIQLGNKRPSACGSNRICWSSGDQLSFRGDRLFAFVCTAGVNQTVTHAVKRGLKEGNRFHVCRARLTRSGEAIPVSEWVLPSLTAEHSEELGVERPASKSVHN
jgi:hypothetical protein